MKKDIIICILVILLLGLGGYLVYDKLIEKKESTNQVVETSVENQTVDTKSDISKFVGTYTGDKGTDSFTINEDGTYTFKKAETSQYGVENKFSDGIVVTNDVYVVIVELYNKYVELTPVPHAYYFVINGDSLKLINDNKEFYITDSNIFSK